MCARIGVPATVGSAVAGGVTVVQLRDPQASDAELVALGRAVKAVLAGTGVPLIVNDRVELVAAMDADGAHVGQGDMDVRRARAELGSAAYLGLSVQLPDHVRVAADQPSGTIDYLGVGPVWETASKPDAAQPGGLDVLRVIASVSPWPCVAIGGVTPSRVPTLRSAGVAGVAVVSAVCGQPDVTRAARGLRTAWDNSAPGSGEAETSTLGKREVPRP